MSSHGGNSRGRHPNPKSFTREQHAVGHITFEVADNPKTGCATFALIAGEAPDGKRKPMFTGIVQRGMGTQLRRLAHRFDELEAKLDGQMEGNTHD